MNCDEFIDIYWKNYILIEKEFYETLKYVTLSKENYSTYSVEYQKLILQILIEKMNGELNAVIFQTILSYLYGAGLLSIKSS